MMTIKRINIQIVVTWNLKKKFQMSIRKRVNVFSLVFCLIDYFYYYGLIKMMIKITNA